MKFQTFRNGASRWHVVERAFRAKTGITALREDDGQTELFCHRRPALPGFDLAALAGPAGVTFAFLNKADSSCPVCKGVRFQLLKSIGAEAPPACFECLARPVRS